MNKKDNTLKEFVSSMIKEITKKNKISKKEAIKKLIDFSDKLEELKKKNV